MPAAVPETVAMAHRGAHAPGEDPPVVENTLAALYRAAALGYRWVETDVRASADGVPLLAHDASLARTTGTDVAVAATTWSRLQELTTGPGGGTGPQLVTLEQALDAVPGVHLNLDVKAADAVAPVVALLTRRPELAARVRVTSFSERRRAAVLAGLRAGGVAPVRSSASAPGTAACWATAHAPLPRALRVGALRALAAALRIDCLQVPETAALPPAAGRLVRAVRRAAPRASPVGAGPGGAGPVVLRVVSARLLDAAHAVGLGVHVWVVDEPADMHRLLDAGVDGLVTDEAAVLAAVLAERGTWPAAGAHRPDPTDPTPGSAR